MRCEVCGRRIHGNPLRVIIEGARLTVCGGCAKHGTGYWEEPKPKTRLPPLKKPSRKPLRAEVETTQELIEGFDGKIRQAREKLGLSHEELGRKINEKVSVLKKIETRKMIPDNKLASKLEHILRVKLLVAASDEKIPETKIPKPTSRKLTLGDLIKLSKKKMEEEKG